MTLQSGMRRTHIEATGGALAGLGLVLLLAAILAPDEWLRDGRWSTDDALAHQAASAELHRLSLSDERSEQHLAQLREAYEHVGDLDVALQKSAESAGEFRQMLRWAGGGLCLVGAATVLAARGRR